MSAKDEQITVVFVGHVDHGKSTVVGRLLSDTDSIPQDKQQTDYAYVLDALAQEQSDGVTLQMARAFMNLSSKNCMLIDAPGHVELLKNMVTGAAQADFGFLVVDAEAGIEENTRRHGLLLSLLGVRELSVIVNKMDLVAYREEVFQQIVSDSREFLSEINLSPQSFIPLSAKFGDNVLQSSDNMSWYDGHTIVEQLDKLSLDEKPNSNEFRMYVQDIYQGHIVAGTIGSGVVKKGDRLLNCLTNSSYRLEKIIKYGEDSLAQAQAEDAIGLVFDDLSELSRGTMLSKSNESRPEVSSTFLARVFWLGNTPLQVGKSYEVKIGTNVVKAKASKIERVINSSTLEQELDTEKLDAQHIADCWFELAQPIAFDTIENNFSTSRLVIVDQFNIVGGAIIQAC